MSFILYVVVMVVSISSVMMGLDWLSSPPPPVPKSVQTVSAPAKPDVPVAKKTATAKNESKPAAATTGKANASAIIAADTLKPTDQKSAAATTTAAVKPPAAAAPRSETAGSAPVNAADDALAHAADGATTATGSTGDATGATTDAAVPRCDVQACTARYHSFNSTDCTYQPFEGPRRLCTVGNPPRQANDTSGDVQTSDARPPQASSACNYDACAAAYRSFDPATCTWQPFEGPRRSCKK